MTDIIVILKKSGFNSPKDFLRVGCVFLKCGKLIFSFLLYLPKLSLPAAEVPKYLQGFYDRTPV